LEAEVHRLDLLDRVKFVGWVLPAELAGYTRAADFGVDLLDLNLSKQLASCNKFFEYLHAGIPSLCSDVVEHRRVFANHRVGVLVRNDVDDVCRGIDDLVSLPDLRPMQTACRAAAREHNWQRQTAVLDDVVRSLTAATSTGGRTSPVGA
jgi:glycosyltransferase involved in cell wall biosynthesis